MQRRLRSRHGRINIAIVRGASAHGCETRCSTATTSSNWENRQPAPSSTNQGAQCNPSVRAGPGTCSGQICTLGSAAVVGPPCSGATGPPCYRHTCAALRPRRQSTQRHCTYRMERQRQHYCRRCVCTEMAGPRVLCRQRPQKVVRSCELCECSTPLLPPTKR
jgi:hypothetical protein